MRTGRLGLGLAWKGKKFCQATCGWTLTSDRQSCLVGHRVYLTLRRSIGEISPLHGSARTWGAVLMTFLIGLAVSFWRPQSGAAWHPGRPTALAQVGASPGTKSMPCAFLFCDTRVFCLGVPFEPRLPEVSAHRKYLRSAKIMQNPLPLKPCMVPKVGQYSVPGTHLESSL